MSLLPTFGISWVPAKLGRSLPIYRRLLWTRLGAVGLILGSAVGLWWLAGRSARPTVQPLAAEKVERLVRDEVRRASVRPWDPGPPLEPTAPPSWQSPPIPGFARAPHPGESPLRDEAAELTALALKDAEAGRDEAAATRLLRAVEEQPTWESRFNAGIGLLRLGDPGAAAAELEQAETLLEGQASRFATSPSHLALRVVTFHALGQAALGARECASAIFHQRWAVQGLRRYVQESDALAPDRRRPFRVAEAGIDNHAVWSSLAEAYAACDGVFPQRYTVPGHRGVSAEGQSFEGEYRAADLDGDEVAKGPFASDLARCVAESPKPDSHCWAKSNLSRVLWANRRYLPRDDAGSGGPTPPEARLGPALAGSLARLVYNAALLAATSDDEADREGAGRWLTYAAVLDRQAEVQGLAGRISELGRYLSPVTGDNSALAERWRRRPDLAELELDELSLEEAKGVAWAKSERWITHLREGRPGEMLAAAEKELRRAGRYGDSLRDWMAGARRDVQDRLAEEIALRRGNGDLAGAVALRDYRGPWLGSRWPDAAAAGWRTGGDVARGAGFFALWLALTAAVLLAYRLIALPYLQYTVDAYRLEHRERHARAKRAGIPFTRDEINR